MGNTPKSTALYVLKGFLALIFSYSSIAFGQLANNLPDNVSQSVALGITANSGLKMTDLMVMAKAVLIRTRNISIEEATSIANKASKAELREIAAKPFLIDYVEVPLSEFQSAGEFNFEKSQKLAGEASPIRFEKNGVQYVRWFFHPLRDSRDFLKKFPSARLTIGKYLAQMTESRSVVVMDRTTSDFWSIKLSLPIAAGPFKNKAFMSQQAYGQLSASESLAASENHFVMEQEAVGIKSDGFDEGILVRSIKPLYRDGKFTVPYASIFTLGLKHFLNPGLNDGQIAMHERAWLAEEPGRVAADRYHFTGMAHNSNHSQNSILVLTSDRMPFRYMQRDADFDVDYRHPKGSEAASQNVGGNVTEYFGIEYSMSNGLKSSFYQGARYEKLITGFFGSFLNRLTKLNNQEPVAKPRRYVTARTYYKYVLPRIYLTPEGRKKIYQDFQKFRIVMEIKFPDLENFEQNPVAKLKKLLLRKNQTANDLENLAKYIRNIYPDLIENAWEELVKEYLNPNKRSFSTISKIIKHNNKAAFGNLCIMAGVLYNPDYETFMETLMAEATKYSGREDEFKKFFEKIFKELPDGKKEIPPLDHQRLEKAYYTWYYKNQSNRRIEGEKQWAAYEAVKKATAAAVMCEGIFLR